MRRPVLALVVLFPGIAAADPAPDPAPVRVAAAPGETVPAGPGGLGPQPAPADPAFAPPPGIAPPGMVAVDRPAPPPRRAAAAPRGIASRLDDDAAASRAYAFGTALTLPSGSFELTWRGPLGVPAGMLGISTGIGDRVEVGVSVVYAGSEGDGAVGGGSLKVQLLRGDRTSLAVHGTAWNVPDEGTVGMVGGILSTCLGPTCSAIVTGHVSALVAAVDGNDEEEVPIVAGASLVAGRGSIKFLTEMMMVEIDSERVALGVLGCRMGGRRIAFDLGLGFGIGEDGGGAFPMGALTIRP